MKKNIEFLEMERCIGFKMSLGSLDQGEQQIDENSSRDNGNEQLFVTTQMNMKYIKIEIKKLPLNFI